MKKTVFVLLALVMLIAVPCLFPTPVLAQPIAEGSQGQPATAATPVQPTVTATLTPTATVALDPSSSCSGGSLDIAITTPISRKREAGRATTSTGTVIRQFEQASGPGTSYTGGYGFLFNSSVPAGTIVTLYGYMGQTPPNATNTAEFSLSYRCDTLAVFQECAGPYGFCIKQPNFPGLDGVWFKLNAVVNGNYVADGNGVTGAIKTHNFSVPFYMGFAWNTTNNNYDVRVFTETAPGVWTNTYTTTRSPLIYSQNFFPDFFLQVNVNNATDFFVTFHTPYIKYVVDKTGVLKSATYSGSGEVLGGSFNSGNTEYFGSVKISGPMVSVSMLPFTP